MNTNRTVAEIDGDIRSATIAREARAAVQSEDGKWDESRAIFIENCNNRIAELVKERERVLGTTT